MLTTLTAESCFALQTKGFTTAGRSLFSPPENEWALKEHFYTILPKQVNYRANEKLKPPEILFL